MSSLHVESPKYINFFNKQWSKIPYYVYFIILNFFIQLIFKNKEIKKKKGSGGIRTRNPGFRGYWTPAQRKLPKTPLINKLFA